MEGTNRPAKGSLRAWLAAGLLLAGPPAGAAVLEVGPSSGFSTVQSAIDAAVPGSDSVFVHCGVYHENIVMKSGVPVTGASPRCTIIDGSGAGSVVTAINNAATTTLAGFTLRNGSAPQGGGIYVEGSALVVRHNVIESNSATGAVFPDGVGGGILIQTDFSRAFTEPQIVGNVIRGNTAERFGGGISIDTDDGSAIADNLIAGNTAGLGGGGINLVFSFPDIVNNTIVRNCSQAAGAACTLGGGGVLVTDSGVVDFHNNLIAWNEAAAGAGGIDVAGSSSLDFLNNDVFGNLPVNYSGVADPTGTAGNLALDPLLVDEIVSAAGHQPRSDSPLLDAGSSALISALDLRGVPRALDGDGDGTGLPDIGARENEGASRLRFVSPDGLAWDGSVNPSAAFNLYRGEMAVLRSLGQYTQDLATAPGSKRWCGLVSNSNTDPQDPPAATTWFYLVTVDGVVEGTLGFDSSPAERPVTPPNGCP